MVTADLRVLNAHREMQTISAFSSINDDSGLFGIFLTTVSNSWQIMSHF